MPEFKANQAAMVGKTIGFSVMFSAFCEVTDPMTAFVFTVSAFMVLKLTS